MATAVANSPDLPYSKPVALSLLLHIALAGTVLVSAYLKLRGDQWNGVGTQLGQSISVTMVPSARIPIPRPPAIHSHTFDPDNGLYKATPQPKAPAPPADAIPLPSPEKTKSKPQPEPPNKPSRLLESKTPRPDNAVNYGKAGRPVIPTGDTTSNPGATPTAGSNVLGQGGGDFATRF